MSDEANEKCGFSVADMRKNLTDLLNRAKYAQERITVTRRGYPIAKLVSIEDSKTLDVCDGIMEKLGLNSKEALQEWLLEQ